MLKILLLCSLLITSIMTMIFGYIYILILNKKNSEERHINQYYEDIILYNVDNMRSKLILSKILNDESILCKNDNLMHDECLDKHEYNLFNNIHYTDDFKDVKKDEKNLIKKILKNN
jgi:hypothetical protein